MKLSVIFISGFLLLHNLECDVEFLGHVQRLQQEDHNDGADKHRNRSKNPKQQGEGEVVASQAKCKEVLAPKNELIYVFRCQTWRIVANRNAEQETSVACVPDRLHMTDKGEKEAE